MASNSTARRKGRRKFAVKPAGYPRLCRYFNEVIDAWNADIPPDLVQEVLGRVHFIRPRHVIVTTCNHRFEFRLRRRWRIHVRDTLLTLEWSRIAPSDISRCVITRPADR